MTGLECGALQLEKARSYPPEGDEIYVEGFGQELPFDDGAYDAVIFFNSLEFAGFAFLYSYYRSSPASASFMLSQTHSLAWVDQSEFPTSLVLQADQRSFSYQPPLTTRPRFEPPLMRRFDAPLLKGSRRFRKFSMTPSTIMKILRPSKKS